MDKPKNSSEALLKAISFAAKAHKNQFRKDEETPYVSHPFRVCMILRHVFKVEDEDALAAAVLHDTIEDTKTDYDALNENFGETIAAYVSDLSKDKREKDEKREAAYMIRLQKAADQVKLIKLADIYDNLTDIGTLPTRAQKEKTLARTQKYLAALQSESPVLQMPLREVGLLHQEVEKQVLAASSCKK